MKGRVYDPNVGRFLSVDPIIANAGSQSLNPYSYLGNNPLSGTDPTGYACQADNKGQVTSTCLLSNDGVNQITDSSGKALGTVVVADKGSTISLNFSNGGSLSATFTGKTGDISRVLNGPAASDVGAISRLTNGTLEGTTASYALGNDKSPALVDDWGGRQQQQQRAAEFEAYRQETFAHEGLGKPLDEALKLIPVVGAADTVANCVTGKCSAAGLAMATLGVVLPESKMLGSIAKSGVKILEQEDNVIIATFKVAKGEARVAAEMVQDGDRLILRGVHIEGDATLKEALSAAKSFGRERGAKEVVIEGGVRTTGAKPGHLPRSITVNTEP
jgi:hypothetical protein